MDISKAIIKHWGNPGVCPKNPNNYHTHHWAFYNFENKEDAQYWEKDHKDNELKRYWRHYEFMSIPCIYCGVYSPLRCSNQFITKSKKTSCNKDEIINYHPNNTLPDNLAYYSENGWTYVYFKETLSDSLCGQETFKLRHNPYEK